MRSINVYVAVLLCLVSFLSLISTSPQVFPKISLSENSGILRYEVNDAFVENFMHSVQIENPTSTRVTGGKLFVPIVKNDTARHYGILHDVSATVGQPTFFSDSSGNTYAYWSNIEINGYQKITVELNYYILSFSIGYYVNPELTTEFDKGSDFYKKFTHSEELIQSDNPKIVSTARDIISDENLRSAQAYKIYSYVITHMRYEAQDEERGALWALDNGKGDCSEYSYLFVALCRAAGIPAKIQAGFAFHSFSETSEDGHMWSEYYLENYGWVPVDATWKLFNKIDGKHLSSMQSMPESVPYSNYIFNYTSGPKESQIEETQSISLKPSTISALDDNSLQSIAETIQQQKQAKLVVLIEKIMGAPIIFPQEANEVDNALLESRIQLQNAIEIWKENPEKAQSSTLKASENAGKALPNAGMLVAYMFTISIGVLITTALVLMLILKRRQNKPQKKTTEFLLR